MTETIKEYRLQLDGFAQLIGKIYKEDGVDATVYTIHLERCECSLLLAKAWLGKINGLLGEASPYKNDGNRNSVKDIEKPAERIDLTVDQTAVPKAEWIKGNNIQRIDWMREELKKIYDNTSVEKIEDKVVGIDLDDSQEADIFIMYGAFRTHLAEARFHLGFELGDIKIRKESQEKARL